MKTIVLDDDPTGTQSAGDVRVLMTWDADRIRDALASADSVYLQTNSRALDESSAVALAAQIRDDVRRALPVTAVRIVLRGDSTLRGHVFAETELFMGAESVMLFVPAFPAGGRTTREGVHYVAIDGSDVPAAETEYAADPVFPFRNSALDAYVQEKSGRVPAAIPLGTVRAGGAGLVEAIMAVPVGSVIVPDAVTDADIARIARAVEAAELRGRSIVVRSAAPLAAELAGVRSDGLLVGPVADATSRVLVACGSHTGGATAQLAALADEAGEPEVLSTDDALADPDEAGRALARRALARDAEVTVISSERHRRGTDNGLHHGERVMSGLVRAAREIAPHVDIVVAKGGITSAEIARSALGASSAFVLGQILPGVSLWRLRAYDGRERLYVVVPGNVGDPTTLVRVMRALGR
ncbi:four-carbon acid sugar kinase family protein [Microbacterium sp.]|uniref:four-carbon acid sugar kinase family protein n=1 Tax=Microbacterium sp. TaxID=51671 RepID=UPI003A856248